MYDIILVVNDIVMLVS